MLWQRKIELEREMNDVLDPSVGGDVVGAMKKEIHRMQLRAAELSRIQESLLLDMERSITKRDTIALKVISHCLSCFPFLSKTPQLSRGPDTTFHTSSQMLYYQCLHVTCEDCGTQQSAVQQPCPCVPLTPATCLCLFLSASC